MGKLQVYRFYKEIGLDGNTLIHHVTKEENGRFFGVYYDLSEQFLDDREAPFVDTFINKLSLIETLTPREALILLANGFVLKSCELQLKVDLETGNILIKMLEGSNFQVYGFGISFDDLTIYALPEAENG